MNKGAFIVSRGIFENDIWNDIPKFRIFFYILGNAVFSEEGFSQAGIKLKKGQYLRSMRNLQDDLSYREGRGNSIKKYPLTTIQRKIKSLVNEERITVKSTEYGTLFTVVNYASYQHLDNYKNSSVEQQRNNNGTAVEQQRNNNKNVKESKNDKNEKNKDSRIRDIFNHYLDKNIIQHTKITSSMRSAIKARLKDYTYEQLIQAIDNYSTVYHGGSKYWFDTKYSLTDLMRDKDVRKFIDDAEPLNNFLKNNKNEYIPMNQRFDPQRDAF